MSAARDFVAGRGAIPIADLATWLGRTPRFVYGLIYKGALDKFTAGRVTADSVLRFYEQHEGGAANEVKRNTSRPVPVTAAHREIDRVGRVTGAAISGGAS